MSKAIWTASISFGLINIPVKMFSATEDHSIKSHQIHTADSGAIKYAKTCADCGETIDYADISKSYDTEDGTVILTDDDLANLPAGADRTIDVLEFVSVNEIDPLAFGTAYHLAPADILGSGPKRRPSTAIKSYSLLARTLEASGLVAIVRYTFREKNHLAALRTVGKGNVLAIHTLRWSDEIREPDFPVLNAEVEITEAELTLAGQLVESMRAPWNPDRHQDEYTMELRELIASKTPEGEAEVGADYVSDLISKLEGSLPRPKRKSRAKVAI